MVYSILFRYIFLSAPGLVMQARTAREKARAKAAKTRERRAKEKTKAKVSGRE